jgi:hypothetical protein
VATKPGNIFPATALACGAVAIAVAWCGAAEAKTGLAPVVAEGGLGLKVARKAERAALKILAKHGVNSPAPATIEAKLGLAGPTDPPTTAQCVAAGRALGLDVIVALRLRPTGDLVEVEVRVVVVDSGTEHVYTANDDAAHVPRAVQNLVLAVFDDVRTWDTELVDVERALGRDEDKPYARWLADDDSEKGTFARYMHDRAARRRNASVVVGIALPILVASATVWFGYATRGIWRDLQHNEEDDDGVCIACGLGDILLGVARVGVVIGYVAGIALTLVSAAVPIAIYGHRTREMARLRPLLTDEAAEPPAIVWSFAPYASPEGAGLALDLRF